MENLHTDRSCPECPCDNWTGFCGHLDCGACSRLRAEQVKIRYEWRVSQGRIECTHDEDAGWNAPLTCEKCREENNIPRWWKFD